MGFIFRKQGAASSDQLIQFATRRPLSLGGLLLTGLLLMGIVLGGTGFAAGATAGYRVYAPIVQQHSPNPLPNLRLRARNVILLIGDGMGPEQVKAGGLYRNGAAGSLSFESFPYQAQMTTHQANGGVTNSAAAATAMATGVKVKNLTISQRIPGSGEDLYTLLELARDQGRATGLVTTSTLTDATPAAFAAHTDDRQNRGKIAADYLQRARPNVLLGGGGNGLTPAAAQAAGCQVVLTAAEMDALVSGTPAGRVPSCVTGLFGEAPMPYEYDGLGDLPHLSRMAAAALDLLDDDPDGMFLMIEGGLIDHAAHLNDVERMVREVAEFSDTVQLVREWAESHPDTLIFVLADHETGGLRVLDGRGQGSAPQVSWSTSGHTSTPVNVYLWSPTDLGLPPQIDNTEIPALVTVPPERAADPDFFLFAPGERCRALGCYWRR